MRTFRIVLPAVATLVLATAPGVARTVGDGDRDDSADRNVQRELGLAKLASAKKKLFELQDKREELDYQLKLHKHLRNELLSQQPITPKQIDAAVEEHPEVRGLREELGEAKLVREDVARVVRGGKESPQYHRADQQVKRLQRELDARRKSIRGESKEKIREARLGQLDRAIENMESQVYFLKLFEEGLSARVNELVHETGDVVAPSPRALEMKLNQILERLDKLEKRRDKLERKRPDGP